MKTLLDIKDAVNAETARYLEEYASTVSAHDPLIPELVEIVQRVILSGGKRVRPYLAYVAYCGSGGKDETSIIQLGVALELFHSFLLIHDDIVDEDEVRHGAKNVQGEYHQRFSALGDSHAGRYAPYIALLAGDMVHTLSNRIITHLNIDAEAKINILQRMQEATLAVASGEVVDVIISTGLPDVAISEERILDMYANKTGAYTFDLPLHVGRILAGASESAGNNESKISEVAHTLGIAYQLTDDLMGIFGDQEKTGKSVDGDIRQGKRTLIYACALKMLPAKERELFISQYGQPDLDESGIQQIRALLETHGVRAAIEERCTAYFAEAESGLAELPFSPEALEALREIVTTIRTRIA